MATVQERVAAGAALLDERRPDWFKAIDASLIDIASSERCICGQLYGGYTPGISILAVSPTEHGFTIGESTRELINAEWRDAVASRLAKVEERELVLA